MAELKYKPVMMQEAVRDRFSEIEEELKKAEDKLKSIESQFQSRMERAEKLRKKYQWKNACRR